MATLYSFLNPEYVGETMSHECVQVLRGTPWFDTVDQEHVPLEIVNLCGRDVIIDFEVLGLPNKEVVYRSGNVRIGSSGKHAVEIVTDKYYESLEVKVAVKNKEPHLMSVEIQLR